MDQRCKNATVTVAVAGASVALTVLAAGSPLLFVWWVIAPALAVAAVGTGVWRHRPRRLAPWSVLLAALLLLWVGWSLSAAMAMGIGGETASDMIALVRDGLYVLAYPTLGVASLLMVRARTGGRDRDNAIDALIVMVALASALGAWLFATPVADGMAGTLGWAWVRVSPLVLAAVVAASVRMLLVAGGRLPAAWLMLTASLLTLLGNLWTSQLIRDGSPTQVTGIDVLWVLAFVAVGAAALHPSMRELTEPIVADRLHHGMPVDRLALLGAAMMAAPLAHLRMTERSFEQVAVAVGGAVVALLAVWRVSRLFRERDHARQALGVAAAQDAMIATLGHRALDDRSIDELLADADALLSDTFPGVGITAEAANGPASLGRQSPRRSSHVIDDGSRPLGEIIVPVGAGHVDAPGRNDFFEAVAALLSSAARRRAAEEKLRHDALHDPLTGLPNRALAVDRLTRLLGPSHEGDVTVVFLDLDGFKAVNDTFGHEAGDRALCEIADRLLDSVRTDDTVARFAGDEFVVLAPHGRRPALDDLVSRLAVATTLQVIEHGRALDISASMGVASRRSGTIDAEGLLQLADAAMYRAKRRGPATAAWDVSPPAISA